MGFETVALHRRRQKRVIMSTSLWDLKLFGNVICGMPVQIMSTSLWDLKLYNAGKSVDGGNIMSTSLWDLKRTVYNNFGENLENHEHIPMGFETTFIKTAIAFIWIMSTSLWDLKLV